MATQELDLSGRPLLGTTRDKNLFVDRSDEIKKLEAAVRANMNVLLLGDHGTGKTSLLHQLGRRLNREDTRTVYVEARLATNPLDFLNLLRTRLSPTVEMPSVPQQWGLALSSLTLLTEPYTTRRRPSTETVSVSELLLETIHAIGRDLKNVERRQIALVDETSPELVHTVFGRLRDEIWQLPVVWVVAGANADRNLYLRPPADAFFSRVIGLEPLSETIAFKLLRARVPRARASDGILRAITAASNGLPRNLIQLAADVLVDGVDLEQVTGSRAERDSIVAAVGEPAERVVADLEANGPTSASDEAFLGRLGFGRSRAAQIFNELERVGVVEASVDTEPGKGRRRIYALRGRS